MQHVNTIFVEQHIPRAELAAAVARVFDIPQTNVFFDADDTAGWDAAPVHAFVYTLSGSDVAWMLEIGVRDDLDLDTALPALSAKLNSTVLFDAAGQQYVDDVIAISSTGARAPAVLGSQDADGTVIHTYRRAPDFGGVAG